MLREYIAQMRRKKRWIPESIFLCYVAVLLYFLLFAERNVQGLNGYNIHLFAEIQRYLQYRNILGTKLVIQNLAGNVIGFIPFGLFLPQMNVRFNKIWKITLTAATFSLMIEVIQRLTAVGCFDVDDVFLNTVGGLLGACLWGIFAKIRNRYGIKKETEKV